MQRVLTAVGFCVACSLVADRACAQACNSSAGNGVTPSVDHANVGDQTFWRIDTFAGSAPNNCSFIFEGVTWYPPNQPVPAGTSPCDDITEGIQLPLPPGGPHVLGPGQFLTYTGKNPPDVPCPPGGPFVNCEIFASELIYTVSQADLIPDPGDALGQVVLGEACSGLTIVGVGEDNSKEASGVIEVTNPEIDIQKEAEPDTICQGQDTEVTYTYEVTIPPGGDVSLVNVVVTDDMCSPVVRGPDILGNNDNVLNFDPLSGVAEIWSYSCMTTLSQTTTNTATAMGDDEFTGLTATDTDTATVTALVCDVNIDKTCSPCNPDTGVSPISITVTNNSGAGIALENCVVTDEVFLADPSCPGSGTGTPISGPAPFGLPAGGSTTIPLSLGPPGLLAAAANNASVTCDVMGLGVSVSADDCDVCEPCPECDADVDKQVSCDGGMTFQDMGYNDGGTFGCTGSAGSDIIVRYVAQNTSTSGVELINCQLSDSNTEILPGAVAIVGPIALAPGDTIHEVTVPCSETLTQMEPNTATLVCDCAVELDVFDTVTSTDTANIECQVVEVGFCRVTGGSVSFEDDDPNCSDDCEEDPKATSGGQVGAPGSIFGEWTHHVLGEFTFHGGTHSAPEETFAEVVSCSDEGFCHPARPAPFKQINIKGVGEFKNIHNHGSFPLISDNPNVDAGDTLHFFTIHIEDLGEPGGNHPNQRRTGGAGGGSGDSPPDEDICPAEGKTEWPSLPGWVPQPISDGLADCDCPDYYRIVIYQNSCDPTPSGDGAACDPGPVIYQLEEYINTGNFQIHPSLD